MPKNKDYRWSNLETKSSLWPENEWPYAIKFFYTNGSFNYRDTLKYINENASRNMTSLPIDVLQRHQQKCTNK